MKINENKIVFYRKWIQPLCLSNEVKNKQKQKAEILHALFSVESLAQNTLTYRKYLINTWMSE